MRLISIALLLLLTTTVYSQKPPRGTILIVVKNKLFKEDNILKANRILLENGYQPEKIDSAQNWMESKKKRIPYSDASYKLCFLIKDSAIAVYGKITDAYMPNTLSNQIYFYIQNKGEPGSPLRESFKIMFELTKKLGGTPYFITDLKDLPSIFDSQEDADDIYFQAPKNKKSENEDSSVGI